MIARRRFLAGLGLAPLVARSYFDIGAAWQRHASGLIVPTSDHHLRFTVEDVARLFNVPVHLLLSDPLPAIAERAWRRGWRP